MSGLMKGKAVGRLTALAVSATMALLVAPVRAQDRLAITWPTDGVLIAGQTVTIPWSGGDPSWQIYITLADVNLWTVTAVVTNGTPNTGTFEWTIPAQDSHGSTCGRSYLFYVQEVGGAEWAYGPTFRILCEQHGTITVTNRNDSGPGSLREAISIAAPGATIEFAEWVRGTITLSETLTINKDLTINGPGAALLAVSGNSSVLVFATAFYTNVTISGLTVSGGFNAFPGGWGGGIRNTGSMTVSECVITGNTIPAGGGPGGGIFNYSSLRLINSVVSGNSAAYGGGGVWNNGNATLEITGSTISANSSAGDGAGVSNVDGTVTILRSRITGNSNPASGGGVSSVRSSQVRNATLTIVDSTISENSNNGIFNWGNGTLTITGSTISGNTSVGWGGGINNWGTATIINSTFANNSALSGGGMMAYAGWTRISNSTFSGNRASQNGGGIHGRPTIKNTVLADSGAGGNCFDPYTLVNTSLGHNLSDDSSCSSGFTQPGDLNGLPAGLDVAGLQDHGGLTETIAPAWGSPAIDAIPVSECTDADSNAVASDQRGVARPQGAACDIGAFEASSNTPPSADAGADQGTYVGNLVVLDGSASSDTDFDPITFSWALSARPAGSTATLSNANTANPSLVPDLPGAYMVELIVSDPFVASSPDTVTVAVVTTTDFAGQMTVDTINIGASLPPESVTTGGGQTAFVNFLTQVTAALQLGDFTDAKKKLQDAIERTDGCVLRGAPDGRGGGQIRQDYITVCSDQARVYALLKAALDSLGGGL